MTADEPEDAAALQPTAGANGDQSADAGAAVAPTAALPRRGRSWRHLRSEHVADLILFRARFDWFEHPGSGTVFKRIVLPSGDWVNVVPRTASGQLVMVRQFRFGTRTVTLETPGGMVDPGEDHAAAARRELLEETGYGGGTWRYLGAVEPNPAIHDHLCHHWLADNVVPVQAQTPGAGEDLELLLLAPEHLPHEIASGRLRHALALSALSRVYRLFDDI